MADPQKPCVKCGAVERYKCGDCRACKRNRIRIRKRIAGDLTKPCVKCGAVDRYKCGDCRACKRMRSPIDLTKPCVKCGAVDRYKCGDCRACEQNRTRELRKVHGYHESRLKQLHKHRRLKFEFSLQTQQNALTERQ